MRKSLRQSVGRKSIRKWTEDILVYLALGILGLTALMPVAFILSTSLKEMGAVFEFPPRLIPNPITFEGYQEAFKIIPLVRYFFNTLLLTAIRVLGTLISASIVAFGFARYRGPFKEILFIIVLSPLFLPEQVTLVPLFVAYKNLGWLDSYLPLTVPFFFGGRAFFIFMLRQFFTTIPMELDEAARLDGASEFRILWQIILPLSMPALATVAIFTFMDSWNDFMMPLIFINSTENMVLTQGLARLIGQAGTTLWNSLMAAALVSVLPPLLLFIFAQRYFVQGIQMTGSKG
jgi:ABC-type glycerol-3-phosphate transport system permease component